ncbi:MAG: hypothetical protein L6300_06920 [Syntrophaceae bacterium]|nr:hypothetical protein [Candidatus Altiarchaeota archaeon]MBU4341571.1 hypothetical protein [Candidatus Altiarchaeota archaeon]MBU4437333.1 hypothetical protein [Candidatus Altiarchaeota archaeon]MCG2739957.1 hypothetical protein [Syntrophaceae bacterium]MCG2783141.1 hypothetical protein [Candidatus Altiarchaeales archaeon]
MLPPSKYQIAKFLILSFVIVYALYFKSHMPVTLVLILEILLLIKLLPVRQFIEGKIISRYPQYSSLNVWVRRIILFAVYVLLYTVLKFIIVNVIMMAMLHIPVEEQIYDFINRTQG